MMSTVRVNPQMICGDPPNLPLPTLAKACYFTSDNSVKAQSLAISLLIVLSPCPAASSTRALHGAKPALPKGKGPNVSS
jgi:hypothetical protein